MIYVFRQIIELGYDFPDERHGAGRHPDQAGVAGAGLSHWVSSELHPIKMCCISMMLGLSEDEAAALSERKRDGDTSKEERG